MSAVTAVSRRAFLNGLAASGAFGLVASLPGSRFLSLAEAAAAGSFAPNAFVTIDETGLVTIMVHRSEMGQGIRSTLAMLVADELGASTARVRLEQAPGDEKKYGSQNTDGSHSVRDFFIPLRQMGAAARHMLEAAAAAQWKVPPSEVESREHAVVHKGSGRSLGFAELVASARTQPVPAPAALTLKPLRDLPRVGKRVPPMDAVAMTTGKAVYGIDAALPNMKIAVIARPPVYGGKVASVDSSAAETSPGVVKVVRLPETPPPAGFRQLGGVAVVASNTWAALQGRDKLKITWDDGPNAGYDSAVYRTALESAVRKPGRVVRNEGDVDAALKAASTRHAADYYVPHLAHAVMEPPAALASVANGSCEIWACTQHPQGMRDEVAKALDIPVDKVTVHVTFLGGGFGRKSKPDFAVEAALLSGEVAAPVKVVWTREDEIRHGYYHAVAAQHLEAGLDAQGGAVAWLHRSAFPAIGSTFAPKQTGPSDGEMALGAVDVPWHVPNLRCEACDAPAHVRIGWFRSVSNIQHAFAIGSFVDELAHAAKRDPRDFLLDLIGPARHVDPTRGGVKEWNYGQDSKTFPLDTARLRHVVEIATKQADWGRTLPKGRGLGLAVHRSFLTYVATVVEVAVADDGTLSVPHVWVAADCGFAANPDRVRSQMEGASVMALTLALYGNLTFKNGRAEQGNFTDFRLAAMPMAPRTIDVHIVDSQAPPAGVGEPGVPPFPPALCNAIFAATGKRIRALPIGEKITI